MKVLVTGATGFIGSHLVNRLVQEGHHVRALARHSSQVDHLHALGCEVVYGDLGNEASLRPAIAGVNAVYHAGAAVGVSHWASIEDITVRGTERMLRLSLEAGIERFVHISSLAVYRTADIPENAIIDENRELEPYPESVGAYCRSKVEAERLVFEYYRHGLPVAVVRPGLIYGPGGNVFWPNIGFQKNNVCIVLGSVDSFLPFTYINNVIDALVQSGSVPEAVGRAYHIVDGNGMTKRQYLRRYMEDLEADMRVVQVPLWMLTSPAMISGLLGRFGIRIPFPSRYALISKYHGLRCDTSRAKSDLGWEPRVSLDGGLERTFDWHNRSRFNMVAPGLPR